MYIKTNNNQPVKFPYSLGDFKADNPNTSFPAVISGELLAEFGVYPVTPTPAPTFDSKIQRVSQTAQLVNGAWLQVWTVKDLPTNEASGNVRAERNSRLAECDWTQLEDSPLNLDGKNAWALYRETLRMIPQQAGFPYNVTWPPTPTT